MLRQAYLSLRELVAVLFASSLLLTLIAYAVDQTTGLFEISVGAIVILLLSFYLLFGSGSVFFDIVFANAITVYLCFFTFFVESLFMKVDHIFLAAGFIFPLASFLAGVVLRRRKIRGIVTAGLEDSDVEFARSFLWLLPISAIGVAAFAIHQGTDFDQETLNYAFLTEMGLIGLVVFLASKDFALLLMDTGIIFGNLFSKNINLIKPAFAFFTFYSMNIVVFAALYRLIDQLSSVHHFTVNGVARDLTFVESLYFSLVTISTLGYGDILASTNAIRLVVGLESFFGTVLFFFGVHAILTHRKG